MIDLAKLEPVLNGYQTYFPKHWPRGEDFKWEAAQHFHDHWNIDAIDFAGMFKEATAKASSLLDTGYAYPRAMILNFAAADCEATRAMFRSLFDESTELSQRIIAFQAATEEIHTKYNDGSWNNHYQNTSAISVYLWLRYPDQYYIYRYSVARDISDALNFDAPPKRDGSVESLLNSYRLYDELRAALSQNIAVAQMIRSAIDAAPAGKYWPDTYWNIAAIDLGFYLSRYYLQEQTVAQKESEWFPSKADYDPGITTEQWISLLNDPSVFTQNALRIMKCMLDYGGQATCKQLAIKYGEAAGFYNMGSSSLARRVVEKTNCPLMPRDSENSRWWPVLYTGKSADSKEDGSFIWRLRDELIQALKKTDLSHIPLYAVSSEKDSASPRHYWWLTASPKIWQFSDLKVGEEQSYTLYNESGHKRRIFQNILDAKAGDPVICYEANPVKKVVALAKITQENNGKELYFEKIENLISPIEYSTLKDCPELEKMEFFVQQNGSLFKLSEGEYNFILDLIREENPAPDRSIASNAYTKSDFLNSVFLSEPRYDVLVSLLRRKKNVILQGAPGVGKTYAAKRLAYSMMGQADSSRVEFVQFHQSIEGFIVKRSLIFQKSLGSERRFYLEEAEASAQCIVDHGQTAVGGVHHADDVEIFRDIEGQPIIGQRDLFTPVVAFDQHHQLTEDLAQVAPVDLIDEEKVFSVGVVGSFLTEAVKYTLGQLEAGAIRSVAQHEILVRVILMELHELHPGGIGLTHHRVRQPFGGIGLSNAGCALQNDIFLAVQ